MNAQQVILSKTTSANRFEVRYAGKVVGRITMNSKGHWVARYAGIDSVHTTKAAAAQSLVK